MRAPLRLKALVLGALVTRLRPSYCPMETMAGQGMGQLNREVKGTHGTILWEPSRVVIGVLVYIASAKHLSQRPVSPCRPQKQGW